jgi:CBS domain containing-hemolysin-like protein
VLASKTPVISIVTNLSSLITIPKNSIIEEAADLMLKNRVRHLAVVEDESNKNIIGIITTTDLAKYLSKKLQFIDRKSSVLVQALYAEEAAEERDISADWIS